MFSSKSWKNRETEAAGRDTLTLFTVREKMVLQRLIVIARLPQLLAHRTELGAHYERLNFQLGKKYIWDHITGLLLIYPTCLLHVIESSREVLLSVLKDLKDMQQTDCSMLEAPKVVYMAHDPPSRLFQQWSYKVLDADQVTGDPVAKGDEEKDENTETLVCRVLSALQNLGKHLELSKKETLPGAVLDEAVELIISQDVLLKLLTRGQLQSPQLHLQMYDSPRNSTMGSGQVNRSSCLTTV